MANARKILIADPDVGALRPLTKTLRAAGYQVQHATDGSKALEVAVLRHPDVILLSEHCPLIEAKVFIQIIRSNPRTEDIPVIVTAAAQDAAHFRHHADGVLEKPFNLDEVLARVEHVCRRSEAAQELRGDPREIEGALTQLPLVDLLQIMAMNHRSGRLVLRRGVERGEIQIAEGRPVNARLNEIDGEKALFRLIGWKEGNFAFHPGPAPTRSSINRTMEEVLLEGMRQSDERVRLLSGLPPPSQRLSVVPEAGELIEPHPVTKEILRVLAQPKTLNELIDLADATDLDVLGSLSTLLDKGIVQLVHGADEGTRAPLLTGAEAHRLRGKILRVKGAEPAVAKVVFCGAGSTAGRWFLGAFDGLQATAREPAALRSSFGTLGTYSVNELLKLDFVIVPTADAARPLWRPFLSKAVGAIVFEEGEGVLKLARYCAFDLRLPLVIATGESPSPIVTSLQSAPYGLAVVSADPTEAIRTLLVTALNRVDQDDRRPLPAG